MSKKIKKQPIKIQGWYDVTEAYTKFTEGVTVNTILELGSWKGRSAITMAGLNPRATIYCVDTWLGSFEMYNMPSVRKQIPTAYDEFLENVAPYKIMPLRMTSVCGLKYVHWQNIEPDVIFIDASHEFEEMKIDVALARELFPKAIIFGDDYADEWPGVREVVDSYDHELCGRYWKLK